MQRNIGFDRMDQIVKRELLLGFGEHAVVKIEEEAVFLLSDMSPNAPIIDDNGNSDMTDEVILGTKLDCNYSGIVDIMRQNNITK